MSRPEVHALADELRSDCLRTLVDRDVISSDHEPRSVELAEEVEPVNRRLRLITSGATGDDHPAEDGRNRPYSR